MLVENDFCFPQLVVFVVGVGAVSVLFAAEAKVLLHLPSCFRLTTPDDTRDVDATLICLMCQFPSTMNVQEHFNENIMKIHHGLHRV